MTASGLHRRRIAAACKAVADSGVRVAEISIPSAIGIAVYADGFNDATRTGAARREMFSANCNLLIEKTGYCSHQPPSGYAHVPWHVVNNTIFQRDFLCKLGSPTENDAGIRAGSSRRSSIGIAACSPGRRFAWLAGHRRPVADVPSANPSTRTLPRHRFRKHKRRQRWARWFAGTCRTVARTRKPSRPSNSDSSSVNFSTTVYRMLSGADSWYYRADRWTGHSAFPSSLSCKCNYSRRFTTPITAHR